jgi:hypothetical protein
MLRVGASRQVAGFSASSKEPFNSLQVSDLIVGWNQAVKRSLGGTDVGIRKTK